MLLFINYLVRLTVATTSLQPNCYRVPARVRVGTWAIKLRVEFTTARSGSGTLVVGRLRSGMRGARFQLR